MHGGAAAVRLKPPAAIGRAERRSRRRNLLGDNAEMALFGLTLGDIDTRLFDAYANGWTFGLILATVLFIFAAVQIRAWYHDQSGPADDDETFLLALHDSRREGVVSHEEFRSIQSKLSTRSSAPVASSDAAGTLNETLVSSDAEAATLSEPDPMAEPSGSMRNQDTTNEPRGEPPA